MTTRRLTVLAAIVVVAATVGGCKVQPVDPTGRTWVQITPPGLSLRQSDFNNGNFGMQTIVVAPSDPSIVYLGTCYQGVWRTTDQGTTWTKVNTGTNGAKLDSGRNWTLAVDPTDAQVLYTTSGYGEEQGVWKSTNGGVDWQQMMDASVVAATSRDVYSIAIDPADHLHLLVGFHSGWAGNFTGPAGVLESRDGGATWIAHQLPDLGYGHYVLFVSSTTWLVHTQGKGLWRTTDSGQSWAQVSTVDMSHGGDQLYRAANGAIYVGGVATALRSTDEGATWTEVGPRAPDGYYAVVGDGNTLYTAEAYTGAANRPSYYFTSPESDGSTWTRHNDQQFSDGPMSMAYDPVHGVLYSSNWDAGVWKLDVAPRGDAPAAAAAVTTTSCPPPTRK